MYAIMGLGLHDLPLASGPCEQSRCHGGSECLPVFETLLLELDVPVMDQPKINSSVSLQAHNTPWRCIDSQNTHTSQKTQQSTADTIRMLSAMIRNAEIWAVPYDLRILQ